MVLSLAKCLLQSLIIIIMILWLSNISQRQTTRLIRARLIPEKTTLVITPRRTTALLTGWLVRKYRCPSLLQGILQVLFKNLLKDKAEARSLKTQTGLR